MIDSLVQGEWVSLCFFTGLLGASHIWFFNGWVLKSDIQGTSELLKVYLAVHEYVLQSLTEQA